MNITKYVGGSVWGTDEININEAIRFMCIPGVRPVIVPAKIPKKRKTNGKTISIKNENKSHFKDITNVFIVDFLLFKWGEIEKCLF